MAEGYKDFVPSTLSAADLEEYCQNQAIMRFADAADRDAKLILVKTEGMFAYLRDLNTLTVYTGVGNTWSTIGPVHGVLPTWTPAVVQSGAVASSVNVLAYQRVGRLIVGSFVLSITGTGTATAVVTVSLPVPAAAGFVTDYGNLGTGFIADASGPTKHEAAICLASTTTMKFRALTSTALPPGFLGNVGFSAALANTDIIGGSFAYPAGADA